MVETLLWVIIFSTYALTFSVGVMFGIYYIYTTVMNNLKRMGPTRIDYQAGEEWKHRKTEEDKETSWLRRLLDSFGKDGDKK